MPILKLEDFYPDYRSDSDNKNLNNFSVYAQDDDKVGTVTDVLVDSETGRFRYFVVDTGFWVFGKKVLLPVGTTRIDYAEERIYVPSMTKEQVESLPNFDNLETVDYDYEEQVRGIYRPAAAATATTTAAPAYDRNTYNYDYDRDLYDLNDQDHNALKLYEERLVAGKTRQKAGEVTIGKHVETDTDRVEVPVEKERVVIERSSPTSSSTVAPGTAFQEGAVARMEVYEETPEIHKEAFVREEVRVRKEVDQDVATAADTVRREELDVDTQGRPTVSK
ncbi:MAG: DUF2382 domain-containing protein [Leptolyngbya sp. Prado105]|jgi:uncharacterized protein (TIGR02271 family)|nr:DUF2382 domain-containing protein [Leptolyngbya sp. Prado105]